MRILASVVLLLLMAGCGPTLERQAVPLWASSQLTGQTAEQLSQYAGQLKQLGFKGLTLEVALRADADGLPSTTRNADSTIAQLKSLELNGIQLAMVLTREHHDSLFRAGKSVQAEAWFARLKAQTERLLKAAPTQPAFVVLGVDYAEMEPYGAQWQTLVSSLKAQYPGIVWLYATSDYRTPYLGLWAAFDGMAICATQAPDGNWKGYARKLHQRISEMALRYQKPVYIVQSNLLGDDRLLQLKNLLRFWDEQTEVRALTLNTLYPTPAPLESESYFGLAADEPVMDYLRSYAEE